MTYFIEKQISSDALMPLLNQMKQRLVDIVVRYWMKKLSHLFLTLFLTKIICVKQKFDNLT